jgi:hypothetical protein
MPVFKYCPHAGNSGGARLPVDKMHERLRALVERT